MTKFIATLALLMGFAVAHVAPAHAYYQFAPANQNNDGGNQ